MNNTLKMTLFWILAIIITISAAIYQRKTGPTHPKNITLNVGETQYKIALVRSHGGDNDCPLAYKIADEEVTGTVSFKRYPTNEEWQIIDLVRDGEKLKGSLPHQPPAGKIEYKVAFFKNGKTLNNPDDYHVVTRFKGGVPAFILVPHVFLIFFAMMLSNLAGILAIARHKKMVFYGNLTFIFLLIGGMVFGPLMQLYAFGELWTGFPKGMDLTDNKTLVAFIFWILAVVMNRKKQRPGWIIAATIIMLMIYLIPHSMFGSELNYESGAITTG
jgi:hypothetical protein